MCCFSIYLLCIGVFRFACHTVRSALWVSVVETMRLGSKNAYLMNHLMGPQ